VDDRYFRCDYSVDLAALAEELISTRQFTFSFAFEDRLPKSVFTFFFTFLFAK
jgi:hypothetical protein